jgi:hypothetical protein
MSEFTRDPKSELDFNALIRGPAAIMRRTKGPDISMDGPDLGGSSLFSYYSVACRHLSGLLDPDGIRDTVGLCHASVGQPICHQPSFTLADLIRSRLLYHPITEW